MPHIVIEHSVESEEQALKLMPALHELVAGIGLFSPDAVKARTQSYDHFMLHGTATSFMHVTISILSGRSQQDREMLADKAFSVLKYHASGVDKLSLDIHEMDVSTYRK